jgi:uncharacterized protein YndB with AHSA1/START domain
VKRDLRIERVFRQSPERVWRAIAEREQVAKWIMATTDFEPVVGHEFTFRAKPRRGWDGTTYCTVTEVDPPRRIAYTWRGGPGNGAPHTLDTIVSFTLAPEGAGTRMVFEQTGFRGLGAVLVSEILRRGWIKMFRQRLERSLDDPAMPATEGRAERA